ncbi:MAG: hypothetical protein OEY51_04960 [Cyclobacteriaceae bacterium]|nr:hypothetical protein [Cyclobacteriaceae bacterium]
MKIRQIILSGIVILASVVTGNAQVTSTDSVSLAPLNAINNVLQGYASRNISLGAYAQIDYNQPLAANEYSIGKMDVHRFVMFMGYQFNDKTQFVTEVEFEHVSEVYVEQAFLNYSFDPRLNFRAGLLLIPMGIINEYHEPTTYYGVERPNLEGNLIPTTWREIGAGFSGSFPSSSLRYQVYLVNGFSGYGASGATFRGSDAFRKGRQKAAESYISSPNLSMKIDYYGIPGLKVGLSGYTGKSQSVLFKGLRKDDEMASYRADSSVVHITMMGLDARYQNKGIVARAQLISAIIGNTDQYNAFSGTDLGSQMMGYYVEAGYDVFHLVNRQMQHKCVPFIRYERYDTHQGVAGSLTENLAYDRTDITLGVNYFLTPGAVLKGDYQVFSNQSSPVKAKQLNFGVGIWF